MSDDDRSDDIKLGEERRELIEKWVGDKTKNPDCPVCGVNSWQVAGSLGRMKALSLTPNVIAAGSYPIALVFCTNCAYVRTFLASEIGLFEPPKPDDPE